MKRVLLLFLWLVIVSGVVIQAQNRGGGDAIVVTWQRYRVKDEEFSVTLPTDPAMATIKVARKSDGKLRLEKRLKTAYDGVDFTVEAFENPKPKQSLEQFINELGLTGEYEYDPASKRSLTIDGFDGIEYSTANKTPAAIVRFLATEKHLYRFIASGPGLEHHANQFFSTIKLGKDPIGIEISDGPGIPIPAPRTDEKIYSGKEVDVKARVLTSSVFKYTAEAQKNQIAGTVILKVVFAKNGQVQNIHVVSGLPYGLSEEAINAARKVKFTPAIKDGKPVSMWFTLEYNFAPLP
ncbi:MAG TPA: energy transducer TonB [Pyrinomonadaceae bacterium]|nr:energy transducer TonB [Pyrinomonadaceae bacterium]